MCNEIESNIVLIKYSLSGQTLSSVNKTVLLKIKETLLLQAGPIDWLLDWKT
jgi:hypothetical protein